MKLLRVGICVLLSFAVLAYGGVEEWSQAVVEVGFAALLVIWALRTYAWDQEGIAISPLLPPLVAFALVVLVQLIFHRTASMYDTRMQFQLLIAYIILLLLLPQAYYRMSHWRGMLWFLMSLGFFVSVFGILQHLTFNGKLYWFRVMRYGGYPFGPYVNRNHFAGFAEILIPVALVPLVLGKVRRERLFLVGLFAIVPIVALLLSASRGGIVSFAVQMVILFSLLLVRRLQSRYMLVGGVLVLCAILAVSWIGVQQVLERFSNYQTVDVSMGKRASMRHDTWRIFLDHPALGTGLGTLQMVFPPYESSYDAKIVNHTHNDYLEALAETGVPGALCCLWFLAILFIESVKGLKDLGGSFGAALNLAGLVGCCGLLVHSLVDFNLHIPANALLFFVSAHLATARLQSSTPGIPENSPPRRKIRKVEAS
ncbi:MAG TPA: O-antigen ligase family protein [Candidatus Acidoferrum sp.]|jgi:O-antigen ligase|nr:O-antigen ligase family protein [Candidatus Acidoferrum sp.]